jgi:hypothetical protein
MSTGLRHLCQKRAAVGHGFACALALLLALELPVAAAPAPMHPPRKARPLCRARLAGTWVMHWGNFRSTLTLSASGDYHCQWPGAQYVGTWGLDRDGRLWITESPRPEVASSWQTYAIRLAPDTLAGPIVVGATGVVVRLEKKKP